MRRIHRHNAELAHLSSESTTVLGRYYTGYRSRRTCERVWFMQGTRQHLPEIVASGGRGTHIDTRTIVVSISS